MSYNNAKSMTQFYANIKPSPKFSEMNLMDTIDVMMTGLKRKDLKISVLQKTLVLNIKLMSFNLQVIIKLILGTYPLKTQKKP